MAPHRLVLFLLAAALSVVDCFAAEQSRSPVSVTPETEPHWLVGQWEGNIDGLSAEERPARTLRVVAVSPDGIVEARWVSVGNELGNADVRIEGSRVQVVPSATTVVELMRESDDLLVGTVTLQNGQAFPIRLGRIIAARDLPKYDGTFASSRRALLSGDAKAALAALEFQANEAEKNAATSQFPNPHRKTASRAYIEASRIARLSGQLQKAIDHGHSALDLAEKANDPGLQVAAIAIVLRAYNGVRRFDKSSELLKKGFEIVKQIPPDSNTRIYNEALLNADLGRESIRLREYQRAVEAFSSGVRLFEEYLARVSKSPAGRQTSLVNVRTVTINDLIWLATAHRLAGEPQAAMAQYRHALRSIEEWGIDYAYKHWLYQGMGETYLSQNQLPQALESFRKALAVAEAQQAPAEIRNASRRIGDISLRTGKTDDAIAYYQRAIEQIESTRSLIDSRAYRQSFFEGFLKPYDDMMEALLQAARREEAFDYNERARSRAFLDLLGSKFWPARGGDLSAGERALQAESRFPSGMAQADEIEGGGLLGGFPSRKGRAEAERAYTDALADVRRENQEQASLMNVEPLKLTQVQELLDPGVTMLEYFVVERAVWLWVVEKDRLRFVQIPIVRNALASKVTALREAIYRLAELKNVRALSQDLFALLIQPALPHIAGKEIIIVPHDVLHYLPFQALLGADGRYLIERYPIHHLSSASLLQFVKEKRRASGDLSAVLPQAGKVLAFGNPDLGDPEKNLEFAELEAQEVKSAYPDSVVYVKKEATEEKSKRLSPNHDILHFATHAELNENDPLSSAVLLAREGKEDGRLEVREIFGMDLKANLVILSGCETGLGKLSTGDELVGLTRAFIYAGTPSVVASLWKVDDSSTAHLMSSFYKNLKTMSKVEALRQAQLKLIHGQASSDLLARRGVGGIGKLGETPSVRLPAPSSISTSHPYFWAPFILVGDGK